MSFGKELKEKMGKLHFLLFHSIYYIFTNDNLLIVQYLVYSFKELLNWTSLKYVIS